MKFTTAAAVALLATTVAAKSYIVHFPEGTDQSIVDTAIDKLKSEGAKITHKYSESSPVSSYSRENPR